jgi:hypothetical protein
LGPHSYDPGITPNGFFWTTPIPEDSVEVHLGKGEATLDVTDVSVFDAFTVPNSLNSAHPLGIVPSTINSLRIHWSGVTRRVQFEDPDPDGLFFGYFLENAATIEVVATTPPSPGKHGFRFVSTATTSSNFAQVGHDHNGSFFS